MTDVSVLSGSEAIKFLEWLDPKGLHNLVAIDPVTKAVEAQTFDFSADFAKLEAEAWVRGRNTTANLYFSINEPRADARRDSKLRRDEIGAVRAFHVDIDNLDGAPDWDMDCMPSAVVDSGNGQWGFWKLDAPLTIGETDVQTIEAQNRALTGRFHGDTQAHNLDRIARLPGTLNIPNEAKRKKGRVEVVSKVLAATALTYAPAEVAAWCAPLAVSQSGADHTQNGKEDPAVEVNSPAVIEACLSILAREDLVAIAGAGGRGVSIALLHALMDEGATADMAAILSHHFLKTEGEDWELHDLKKLARGLLPSRKLAIGAASAQAEFEPQITARLPLHWATREALSNLPDRQWLLGKFLVRRAVTALVSPGGTGKTTFAMMVAVAVATGRSDILGFTVHERTRVLVWNQEDDLEEMKRRLRAVLQFYGVEDVDWEIDGRPGIVLGSGVERPLTIAKRSANGIVAGPDADLLALDIKENNIGVAILDPLIELHQASENDNVEMGAVGRALRDKIAVGANCAILLNHHTRKPPQANANGFAGDMDAGRGAGAMNGVFRVVATLFNVDQKTAKDFGIAEDKRHLYVRFDDAKANMSLKAGEPVFFRREGVRLPESVNDEIGVLSLAAMSKKKRTGDTLIEDAVAHLAGESEAWVTDLAAALTETAFYAEDEAADLARRITVAFRNAKNANGWVAETASRKGYKGPRVRLVFRPE